MPGQGKAEQSKVGQCMAGWDSSTLTVAGGQLGIHRRGGLGAQGTCINCNNATSPNGILALPPLHINCSQAIPAPPMGFCQEIADQ